MAKCPAPRGWPKRPSAVTILGPRWPKRVSAVTAAKGVSPKAPQTPRSLKDYSGLRLLFTPRLSPSGRFLSTLRHFRGPFWPAPLRIRHRGAAFWPVGGTNPTQPAFLNPSPLAGFLASRPRLGPKDAIIGHSWSKEANLARVRRASNSVGERPMTKNVNQSHMAHTRIAINPRSAYVK